jgi:polyisoprenoid-binding protein YceI
MRRDMFVPAALAIVIALGEVITTRAAAVAYRVDPARSHATIHVAKTGVLSFAAGHSHQVTGPLRSGTVDVDADHPEQSRLRLAFAASDLKVSSAGEPEKDVPKVQETMDGEQVLDVAHHPEITYQSSAVRLKKRAGNALDLDVTGQLTVRGVPREVVAPVHVELAGDGLVATGRFAVKQSAFGIKPISVAGVVNVKDELDIEFSIAATR